MYVCGLDHIELGEQFFVLTNCPLMREGAHRMVDRHRRIMGIMERPVKKRRFLVQTTVDFGFFINIVSQQWVRYK